ncbi:MAG TPA: hypothetical protein PKX87_06415 [Alphaproteobacteria bacterium]|nr:hypothetical protein [Alphaproteobacteria bacterium]
MSVAQFAGTVGGGLVVGAMLNEIMRDDPKPKPNQGPDTASERSTSFSKNAATGFVGIVAGVSLMGAFGDALQKPFAPPAPAPVAATPQLAATTAAPTPGLNPFLNGPSFTPGFMG